MWMTSNMLDRWKVPNDQVPDRVLHIYKKPGRPTYGIAAEV